MQDTAADPTATSAWAGHPGWRPRPGSTSQRTSQKGRPLAAWHASSAGTHGLSRGGRAGWAATGDGAVTPTLTSGPLGESVGQSQPGCGGRRAASLPGPARRVHCSPVPTSGPDAAPSRRGPASRGLDPPLRTGRQCSGAEPQLPPVQTWTVRPWAVHWASRPPGKATVSPGGQSPAGAAPKPAAAPSWAKDRPLSGLLLPPASLADPCLPPAPSPSSTHADT